MDTGQLFLSWQKRTEEWREALFKPLLKLLLAGGVSANGLSAFRLFLAAAFPVLIISYPSPAWACMIISIALDALDGAVARFARTANDRGKFVDVLADQATFALLATGLIRAWPQHGFILGTLAFLIPATYLIVAVAKNEKAPSDWLIKPRAQLTLYKIIFLGIVWGAWQAAWPSERTGESFAALALVCSIHFAWRYLRFIHKA